MWNAMFLVATFLAYFVFRASAAAEPRVNFVVFRYAVVVYLSALAAQIFAYAFDANTSLTPPPEVSLWSWYLSPMAGPKTLYGAIVLYPVSVALASLGTRLGLVRALDLWTPKMLVFLAVVRVGCLLQGCCYGAHSELFGVVFPAGSPVYWEQVRGGLIEQGAVAALPVVPTQAIEALFLALLAVWAMRRERSATPSGIFVPTMAAYSVFRFALEFVRADVTRGLYGPLATSQWIALVVLAAAALVWSRQRATGLVRESPPTFSAASVPASPPGLATASSPARPRGVVAP